MWSLPVASRNPSSRRDLPTPASPWTSTTSPRPWQLPSHARHSRSLTDLVADDHRSGGDADPHRELDPWRPRDRGIQLRHRIHDIETGPHRTLGLVLMGARVAEIDEDAVAHVFRDKAVVAPDRRAAPALL